MENMVKELQELQEALENHSYRGTIDGPPYTVQDIYPQYKDKFNLAAQIALDKPKACYQVRQIPGSMECERSVYFVVRVIGTHNIPKAVDLLAAEINMHATLGHIVCPLIALQALELANIGYKPRTDANADIAVFSFPIFTPEGVKSVDLIKSPLTVEEGHMPEITIKDEVVLPGGIATHIFSVGIAEIMVSESPHLHKSLENRKSQLLSLLPRGTEIVSVEESNYISGLSRKFQITLKHPFFTPGMTVELDECRIAWDAGDKIVQDNILFGVTYRSQDGVVILGPGLQYQTS